MPQPNKSIEDVVKELKFIETLIYMGHCARGCEVDEHCRHGVCESV